jgi:phosphatidylglycerophosphate synthase
MTNDPASLDNLRGLALPAPISWWQPQPGWWILLAAILAFAALGIWRLMQSYRANAYRRQALAELKTLSQLPPTEIALPLAALLKRTALCAYSRPVVAGLTGTAWQRFLNDTAGFSETFSQNLQRAGLTGQPLSPAEANAALTAAQDWVRRHKPDPP